MSNKFVNISTSAKLSISSRLHPQQLSAKSHSEQDLWGHTKYI